MLQTLGLEMVVRDKPRLSLAPLLSMRVVVVARETLLQRLTEPRLITELLGLHLAHLGHLREDTIILPTLALTAVLAQVEQVTAIHLEMVAQVFV
jgi:hypothetical protein